MKNLLMLGRVSRVDYKNGCADVIFPDADDMIKTGLPFFSSEYRMPKVNEMVVVIFQKESEKGYILGAVFNAEYRPEVYGKGKYFKRLSERAYIKYDKETETLEFHAPKIKMVQEG